MSVFAGIVWFDGRPNDDGDADRIVRALSAGRSGRVTVRRSQGAFFAGRGAAPLAVGDGTLFAGLARLDNKDELATALGLTPRERAETSDVALLSRIVAKQGERGLARCLGAFAFARWDVSAGQLLLGRDCLGVNHALFFHRGRGFAAFASSLPVLLSLPFTPREIDEIALANFMVLNFRAAERTVYCGVDRVASRTLTTLNASGTRHRRYWSPPTETMRSRQRDETYVEAARARFDAAVATALAGHRRIAISTSGGLDSSAIAATAARLGMAERITCYTLVPPAGALAPDEASRYQDETDKVLALQRMHPALDVRLLAPEASHPFEQDAVHCVAALGAPVMDPTNLGWFSALHDAAAADRTPVLLDGAFGNLGLTWDGRFAIRSMLRSGDWIGAASALRRTAAEDGTGAARAFYAHVLAPAAPAAVNRLTHRLRGRDPKSAARFTALNADFVAASHLGDDLRAAGYDPWFRKAGWDGARHRAFQLFDNNQPARDLWAQLGARHGFGVRMPHADRPLLEFALSLPEPIYRRNGVARSFARVVFADRLPAEILAERRRGAQGGAWFRRLDARRQQVAQEVERLEASSLARRMIDLPRLKRLVDAWPADEDAALAQTWDYRTVLTRALHVGGFIRWIEGGNA